MTNFSIPSFALPNSCSDMSLHTSHSLIFTKINWSAVNTTAESIQSQMLALTSRKSWIILICSFTVHGLRSNACRKLMSPWFNHTCASIYECESTFWNSEWLALRCDFSSAPEIGWSQRVSLVEEGYQVRSAFRSSSARVVSFRRWLWAWSMYRLLDEIAAHRCCKYCSIF